MKTPQFVQLHHHDPQAVRRELVQGLSANSAHGGAWIAPKYFYDALGARLFDAITELPEYYPTRTEAGIFRDNLADMARRLPQGATLIDLGAGNCAKAALLFETLLPRRYVAVDISVQFLRESMTRLQQRYPQLDMLGVGQDFSQTLTLPPEAGAVHEGPRVFFYPGSSIGNFNPAQALEFLSQVHAGCGAVAGGGLLIGVDLVKDHAELQAAYDDALGVTAAFNRNVLLHVNRLCGSDFSVAHWSHVAVYNDAASRIEMHLEALYPVTVQWPGGQRHFSAGERLHTENSYKWTIAGFSQLLRQAGFERLQAWTDAGDDAPGSARFAVFWAS